MCFKKPVRPSVQPSNRPSVRPFVRPTVHPSVRRPSVRSEARGASPTVRPSVHPSVRRRRSRVRVGELDFFPRASSVGFSLCTLTAGVELRAALVEGTWL